MTKEELWQTVLSRIQLLISPANFATWFRNTSILEKNNDAVIIGVPNNFSKEWLEKKYHKMILKALREVEPSIRKIEFKINPAHLYPKRTRRKEVIEYPDQLKFEEVYIDRKTNLNPKYRFDNFVVGPFNELPHAAAWAVSENPGTVYNPLFIYGGVGLGKTHLIQATGNKILSLFPEKKVKYVSSERFTTEVINAIKNHNIEELKQNYRQIDVLIIDDIQFIAGKEKTQEEFFHLFNALYEANKQIIISSDRPPKAISALEERLRSRFEGGMIADISAPDFESRVAILKQKMQERKVNFDEEILEYIAQNIQSNIRELEGALNRLIAYQQIHDTKIVNLEIAKKLLKRVIQPRSKRVTFQHVVQAVCEFYNISQKDLLSKTRKQEIVKPRQIAMYLLREEVKFSFPLIGKKFGGKDHTTAIYAYEKIKKEIEQDTSLEEEINIIKERLKI